MSRARPSASWQVSTAALRTPALAVAILAAVLGGAEIAARTPALHEALPAPSVGSSSRRFELQLDGLDRAVRVDGPIDCLVFGNSTAQMGIDPDALGRAYREATGESLRCFNFGIAGMTASAAGAVAPVVVGRHRPRLLIYVASARDLGHGTEGPRLAGEPWLRCQVGDCSASGWLASHSAAFRYYLLYRQWLDRSRWPTVSAAPVTTTAAGFFPLDGHLPLSPALWARTRRSYARNAGASLSPPEVAGLARVLELSRDGIEVVVVEAPTHPRLRQWARDASSFYAAAIAQMRDAARQHRARFWRPPIGRIIPPEAWVDFVHLDRNGAERFSTWLGRRLAVAVQEGRLAAPHAEAPAAP